MRATDVRATTTDGGIPKKTPLILLWTVATLLWSIFTPPDRTFAARALLLQPLWIVRAVKKDCTWRQDLFFTLALHAAYSSWSGAWNLPDDFKRLHLDEVTLRVYAQVFSLLAFCGTLAGLIVYRGYLLEAAAEGSKENNRRIDEHLLPPLLLPSRTNHSRMFPKEHAFSYSYLFVGVPVGVKGRIGSALSVDSDEEGWFNVKAANFLNRGHEEHDLGEKLKAYLHSQGVTDREYAFAYLVTAPRFLGYSFNPVSFWYLYDSDTRLKYMILEVNNTFDERRVYLLKSENYKTDSGVDLTNDADVDGNGRHKRLMFTDSWAKDFHVSPFNSRKGSYSLRAVDPLAAYEETGQIYVDNTIVLRSSKDHAKIVARVFSEGTPRDPRKITPPELFRFIANWWWVGFLTFPRIVWQARKLYFGQKLNVWFRPEVTAMSIGRQYTRDEKLLESYFRAFLSKAVEGTKDCLRVNYFAAHEPGAKAEVVFYSPGCTYEEDHKRTLTLRVLSPAFYGRFVHYAHAKEAFDRECLSTDEKNRTAVIEAPHLLPTLLDAIKQASQQLDDARTKQNILEQVRWSWQRRLRCPPAAVAYPGQSGMGESNLYTVSDIRQLPASELDFFVQRHCKDRDFYRRVTTEMFLAQRYAFSLPLLMVALDWIIRSALIVTAIAYCERSEAYDILRPAQFTTQVCEATGLMLCLANAVHIWSFAKG